MSTHKVLKIRAPSANTRNYYWEGGKAGAPMPILQMRKVRFGEMKMPSEYQSQEIPETRHREWFCLPVHHP